MDPRQSLSRTASSNVPQNNYQPSTMSTAYSMPPYQSSTHLPPINNYNMPPANQQGYVPQQPYRNDVQHRYPPVSAPPSAAPQDRYNPHMTPPTSMQSGLPPASMLPQPQGQPTPPQNYPQQPPQQQQTRQNYQPALAPAPPRSALDPPTSNYGHPAWTGAEGMPGMTSEVGRDPTRTHVVGSQGRRGILPSAPGRPPVNVNGLNGSPKGGQIPQKDADGKFPCPNCTKTYLHAKHLKRHMLRHTGDRPYMCVLCNDTFSRSDILKRHFQKCSVRRGNPTGASHLSNPAAHLKKSQAAAAKAAANAAAASGTQTPPSNQTPTSNPLPGAPYTSTSMPPNNIPTTAGGAPPTSMAYSMSSTAQADMQRPPSTTQGQVDPASNDQWAMHDARNQPMMYHQGSNPSGHFSMQNQQGDDKRVAMPNAHMGDDWNHMFPGGANEQFMNPVYSGYGQSQQDVKNENHEAGQNGYYMPPTSLGPNPDGIAPRATK